MKHFALIASLLLTGCSGPITLDTTSQETIKSSAQEITADLNAQDREEFSKALMYFSVGGRDGFSSMMGSLADNNDGTKHKTLMYINLQSIDGLTGQEVLEKYRSALAKDKEIRERERVEKEAKQAKSREERLTVRQLSKEAKSLLESKRFEEALEKYHAMSEIDSAKEAAMEGITQTRTAIKAFAEKMEYMDNVEITEFVAKRIDTFSNKDVPAIRVSLKNNGERSLDKVKVTVYFQNKNGDTIFEESFNPVLVGSYSIRNSKPLKAGYVYEMENGKYFTVKSKLSEWDESKTVIKIVDIAFTS
ncbi:DUF6694 family lipoprotein [Alteromonas gracilis]|uniref:DUF6694 family lipoprotein n=1 Tax=Alteromonas gracilis TaxID=1479524 RepID=UPI003736346F